MTEEQAHKFVARWNRIIRPRIIRTPQETIREVLFRLWIFTPVTFVFAAGLAVFLICSRQKSSSILPEILVPAIFHSFLFIFGVLNIFCLRQARGILNQSQIENQKL